LSIPELFPKDTKGYQYYEIYNDAEAVVEHYRTLWKNETKEKDAEAIKASGAGMTQILTIIAGDWLNTKKDKEGAILIYQLIVELFPENKSVNKKIEKMIKKIRK